MRFLEVLCRQASGIYEKLWERMGMYTLQMVILMREMLINMD